MKVTIKESIGLLWFSGTCVRWCLECIINLNYNSRPAAAAQDFGSFQVIELVPKVTDLLTFDLIIQCQWIRSMTSIQLLFDLQLCVNYK